MQNLALLFTRYAAMYVVPLYILLIPGIGLGDTHTDRLPVISRDAEENPPGIAAIVNGETLLISDVTRAAMRKFGPGILEQLVGNTLIEQEAKRANIIATPEEIDVRIATIRDIMKPQLLEDQLKQHHMSLDDMRKELAIEIEVEKMSGKSLPQIKMRHVREILVRVRPNGVQPTEDDSMHSETEAKVIVAKIQRRLKLGTKFEDLAKKYSDDGGNKDKGGDVGILTDVPDSARDFSARMLCALPTVFPAIFTLKAAEVTQTPLATSYGYHFIQVVSTDENHSPEEDNLYRTAKTNAKESQFRLVAPKFVQSLREKGNVEIYLGTYVVGPAGVAATVNGENIPISQVSDRALQYGGTLLDEMITDLLIEQESRKQNLTVDSAEIDAAINEMQNQIKPKTLEDILNQNHITLDELRKTQRNRLLAGKLLLQSLGPQKMVHIKHILIMTKGKAASGITGVRPHTEIEARAIIGKIQNQLETGKTFEELAGQYSEDPSSKNLGGDLGIIQQMNPFGTDFYLAAQALKKGQITTNPVKSEYGLHLIKAESTNASYSPEEKQTYADGEKFRQRIEMQQFLQGYLKSLRQQSKMINYLQP